MEHYIQAVTVRWFNACAYYAASLAHGLAECGHRVTLAGGADTPVIEKAREWGIDVLGGTSYNSHNPFLYMNDIKSFRKYALENNVTLVNAHNGKDHLAWALALRGTGIPLVRTSGNRIPPKVNAGAKILMRKTAGIIATCNTVRGYYSERFGIEREKIAVINGGVDSLYFSTGRPVSNMRDSLGIPKESFVFGIIARYSPVKGHRYFFRAAGLLAKKHHGVRFIVSGWDAQMNESDIRTMASESGVLDKTVFLERQHDIRDLIGSLDAGVIASVGSETVCRIAMEYMAMGIPVVAADTNVITEMVRHGESGYIVPAGDADSMASAMERLVLSKEKARAMGMKGRKIVEMDYTLEAFAERTLEAYGGLTGHD